MEHNTASATARDDADSTGTGAEGDRWLTGAADS